MGLSTEVEGDKEVGDDIGVVDIEVKEDVDIDVEEDVVVEVEEDVDIEVEEDVVVEDVDVDVGGTMTLRFLRNGERKDNRLYISLSFFIFNCIKMILT